MKRTGLVSLMELALDRAWLSLTVVVVAASSFLAVRRASISVVWSEMLRIDIRKMHPSSFLGHLKSANLPWSCDTSDHNSYVSVASVMMADDICSPWR